MTITSEYYLVSVNTSPFEFGGAKKVGCYSTRNTAIRVANFIRLVFGEKVSGGIDIKIQAYKGEMINTPMGLRLKETPNGAITLVHEILSNTEMDRILEFLPLMLQSQIIQPKSSTSIIDKPKYIFEGNYHSVILNFEPFDGSHRLSLGYYQSKQTAKSALDYFMQTYYNEKIGSGFDMSIETYKGKFVQYESGKLYIKIGEDYEVRSSYESSEFNKISKLLMSRL